MTPSLKDASPHSTLQTSPELQSTEPGCDAKLTNASKCILHLFSGPHHREDGFAAAVSRRGHKCVEYDLVNGPDEDLSNDTVWCNLMTQIKEGKFDALLAGPPCNTFTNARKNDGMGPVPLRGPTGDDRYGLKSLDAKNKEKVKMGTLLALRGHEAAAEFHRQTKPYIVEQPQWKRDSDSISMFNLDEYQDLLQQSDVGTLELVQCEYGARTMKPTTLVAGHVRSATFTSKCSHPAQSWRRPSTGERHWGPHPPLKGKEWYVPEGEWRPHMLKAPKLIADEQRTRPFLTSAAQAYPSQLNVKLCDVLVDSIKDEMVTKPEEMILVGRWKNVLKRKLPEDRVTTVKAKVEFTTPLKGKRRRIRDRDEEDDLHLGGMRRPRSASVRIPGYRQAGIVVFRLIMAHLRGNPELLRRCLHAIGSDDPEAGPTEEQLQRFRDGIIEAFNEINTAPHKPALDSKLQAELIWRFARAAGDPDADCIHEWLTEGAPAGISMPIEDPGQIFPPDNDTNVWEDQLLPDHLNHKNYTSVDEDDAAAPEVSRLIETGFVEAFESHKLLSAWLEGSPHLSKLGMITKVKDGKTKRRLILDCKESGVNKLAKGGGRLLLPRVSDIVDDALYLMSQCNHKDQQIEWMIMDFTDWFYNVPLHPRERRHFTWSYGDKWVAFKTQAQGSRNAPLVCGRVAALIARLTQSVFGDQRYRLQIYVDDPCICVMGNSTQRDEMMAATILLWAGFGIRLAYRKAARGMQVVWIGAELTAQNQNKTTAQVQVRAKPEIIEEVHQSTITHSTNNLENKKALQSYVGKLNHVAGMVEMIRPFMSDLYGVLHQTTSTRAPHNCYWTKQWSHVTQWLLAFFERSAGEVCRIYRMSAYFGHGLPVIIVTDASPWGIGGYLMVNNTALAYYSSPVDSFDEKILRLSIGDAAGQQVLEALAVLVALRLWRHYWARVGVSLRIRSDSVSTLTLLVKLRVSCSSSSLSLIARELALEFGTSSYKPLLFQHIPGLSNDWADALSRLTQPGKRVQVPHQLRQCRRTTAPIRDEVYYQSMRPLRKAA